MSFSICLPLVKVCPMGVNVLVLGVMRKRIRISTKEVPHLSGSREAPACKVGEERRNTGTRREALGHTYERET